MKRRDWLLLYIYLPIKKKDLLDPIRIMKGLFLMNMEFGDKLEDVYQFEPYLYGPCSLDLYEDLLNLKTKGLVDEYKPAYSRWSYYRVTDVGVDKAKELIKKAPKELFERLKGIKNEIIDLSFSDLLKKVYKQYPEYAKKSVINFGGKL